MTLDHKVQWTGGLRFTGTSASGFSIDIDGDKLHAASPMEILLLSVAGCACIDVVMILQKARQQITDTWVEIGGERKSDMPRYFTSVEMHFVVTGHAVKEQHVNRAIDLAMEKYCSASAQVAALADIRTCYTIREAKTR